MNLDTDLRINYWEESYHRKDNFIFYPKEEVLKFLNRFVKKRTGINSFEDHIFSKNKKLKALDFGCGIGRQTILLSEFDIDAWGGDISESAVNSARQLTEYMKPVLNGKINFFVLDETNLPFENDFFEIGICDSVLDSMWFTVAKKIIKELDRIISQKLYISLISFDCNKDKKPAEEIVNTTHEKSTVQSYFDMDKINELLNDTKWKIQWYNMVTEIVPQTGFENSRYHIVLNK